MRETGASATEQWHAVIVAYAHTGAQLRWAKRRLERACQHYQELADLVEDFEDENVDAVTVRYHPDADSDEGSLELDWSESKAPPIARIAIVTGELIYNLRAAMDYLVYALAWRNSGHEVLWTQFPIDENPQKFNDHRGTFLNGLAQGDIDVIEEYQPFNGCIWTRTLREFSNPDKHKTLTLVNPQWIPYFELDPESWEPATDDPNVREAAPDRLEVHVMLDEDQPILPTLRNLITETSALIARFNHHFPDEPTLSVTFPEDEGGEASGSPG